MGECVWSNDGMITDRGTEVRSNDGMILTGEQKCEAMME